MNGPWIGIDLDGTLAIWGEGPNQNCDVHVIGEPIPLMVKRVQELHAEGVTLKIFTARVAITGDRTPEGTTDDEVFAAKQRELIDAWCQEHLGFTLPITATKDYHMLACYDDRCIEMVTNTGQSLREQIGEGLIKALQHSAESI